MWLCIPKTIILHLVHFQLTVKHKLNRNVEMYENVLDTFPTRLSALPWTCFWILAGFLGQRLEDADELKEPFEGALCDDPLLRGERGECGGTVVVGAEACVP